MLTVYLLLKSNQKEQIELLNAYLGFNDPKLYKALTKREILKVHILETAMLDTRDTCNYVAERLGAEPVQAIGNKFIIYRKSDEEKYRKIELPRK